MNTTANTTTRETVRTQAGVDAISKGAMSVMTGSALLIGFWAAACMATALINHGPVALVKDWAFSLIG